MKRKNKVLIITYSYPPYFYGLRADSLHRYLKSVDWEAEIVAVRGDIYYSDELSGINYVGNVDGKKTTSIINIAKYFAKIDKSWGGENYNLCKKKAEELIKKSKFDLILATSCNVLFLYTVAFELSQKYKIPWIADVRDIDEEYNEKNKIISKSFFNKIRSTFRRNYLLKKANAIVTVSSWHQSFLSNLLNRKIILIPNGFDPAYFPVRKKEEMLTNKNFNIFYFGTFKLKYWAALETLIETIDTFISDRKVFKSNVRFVIIGKIEDQANGVVSMLSKDYLSINPPVSHWEISRIMLDASILVAFYHSEFLGVRGTKIYEYLTARKPIICIPNCDSDISNILLHTKSGIVTDDKEKLISFMQSQFDEWCERGFTYINGKNDSVIDQFSRQNQAYCFADLFNTVIEEKN